MALIKQGGEPSGTVWTSMGPREPRPALCHLCRERKTGVFTINVNGQTVCADCGGSSVRGVLTDDVVNPQTRD